MDRHPTLLVADAGSIRKPSVARSDFLVNNNMTSIDFLEGLHLWLVLNSHNKKPVEICIIMGLELALGHSQPLCCLVQLTLATDFQHARFDRVMCLISLCCTCSSSAADQGNPKIGHAFVYHEREQNQSMDAWCSHLQNLPCKSIASAPSVHSPKPHLIGLFCELGHPFPLRHQSVY